MWLVVGLGNPGAKYENNRHNIGFMAVDALHSHFAFGPWRRKFQAELSEGAVPGCLEKILLLKPQTYMNLSGEAVQAAVQFYKIPLSRVIVFHDELDVAPGKVKIKTGGGAGGHNGLRSLDQHLGADYMRVRLGIGHPGVHAPNKADLVLAYVLSDFAKADKGWLKELLKKTSEHFAALLQKGPSAFLGLLTQSEKQS